MPLYEYRAQDGERLERFYSMRSTRPEAIQHEGKTYQRVFSTPQIQAFPWKPYASSRLPLNHPDAPEHDERGRACFESQRQEAEFAAKNEMVSERKL